MEKRVWTKEEIISLIEKNDKMVCLSIRELYKKQTIDEQHVGETIEVNGVGFNGVDANIMSSFANYYNERGYLTEKQLRIARKKLPKYATQLTCIANKEVV